MILQTLKTVGAILFGLLAVLSLCSLAEIVLLQALHLSTQSPPASVVLTNLVMALLFAALSVACAISAAHDKKKP